jgi:hypothetical protein
LSSFFTRFFLLYWYTSYLFYISVISNDFWACPSLRSGRAIRCKSSFASLTAGFPLLSLTRMRVYVRTHMKKKCFLPHFLLVGGWAGKPYTPKKHFFRVRHAKGMRACTHGATHRSDSVARSTPTAPRSKQERPKMFIIHFQTR